MLYRVLFITTIGSLCLLSLLLTTTTPATAGPFGLLGIFLSAYLSFVGLISLFLFGITRVIARFSRSMTVKRPVYPMSLRRSYYFATVLAAAPVMLIGLQSVGAVGVYEVILVLLFVVIGCLYIIKRIR